jgi:uncharacterized membrane protein
MAPETYRRGLVGLLLPFVTNVFYMLVAWLFVFRTRQINLEGPAANEESADRRKAYWFRLPIAYLLTVLMVATALVIAGIAKPVMTGWFLIILTAMWLVPATIEAVSCDLRRLKCAADTPGAAAFGNATPDECWKLGLIYYNPDDPAWAVETRAGRFLCGLNFGNK